MMWTTSMLLAFAFSLVALDGGLAASSPSRQVRNLLQAPTRLPTLPAAATVPSPAPSTQCPSNYTVQLGDTYCIIAGKLGISGARLMAANPDIPLTNVAAGQQFRIPCKPQSDCCPNYIVVAPNGTGLAEVLVSRPDLTLDQLVAANPNNANVTAAFVRCGSEIKVPCRAGSPACQGVGYQPSLAPRSSFLSFRSSGSSGSSGKASASSSSGKTPAKTSSTPAKNTAPTRTPSSTTSSPSPPPPSPPPPRPPPPPTSSSVSG